MSDIEKAAKLLEKIISDNRELLSSRHSFREDRRKLDDAVLALRNLKTIADE